jgi:Na+(H+)/acetate symporter ActP
MQTGIWISLTIYFVAMLGIGFYAWKKSTADSEQYMLGGRDLPPAVAALSAGASDMSGWLLLGLPGALYAAGLVEAWIGIGLFIGALISRGLLRADALLQAVIQEGILRFCLRRCLFGTAFRIGERAAFRGLRSNRRFVLRG